MRNDPKTTDQLIQMACRHGGTASHGADVILPPRWPPAPIDNPQYTQMYPVHTSVSRPA